MWETQQSMIDVWNKNLTKRKNACWQIVRNDNTSKIYDGWKNNAPLIIPRKFQMKEIAGESLIQTQRREKQVIYIFKTDIELLELRARSQEEKYRSIDQEMLELVEKKTSRQRRELLKKLWKEDCEREERVSLDRWENTNLKWFDKYEKNVLTFFNLQNPLLRNDDFMPPKLKENIDTEENPEGTTENQNTQDAWDDDVNVTGSSYANATKRSQGNGRYFRGTTYIGKNVQFGNKNA